MANEIEPKPLTPAEIHNITELVQYSQKSSRALVVSLLQHIAYLEAK